MSWILGARRIRLGLCGILCGSLSEVGMSRAQWIVLVINIVGGVAVLGSYWHGLRSIPNAADALWGGVPAGARPLYTVAMVGATLGYFVFGFHLLFGVDASAMELPFGLGYSVFSAVFVIILLPSALWLPLSAAYIAEPSEGLWWAIRGVLWLVATGSVALVALLYGLRSTSPEFFWWPAVIGAGLFAFQTAVLDGIVWVALYRT
jgi:hypothetical protein